MRDERQAMITQVADMMRDLDFCLMTTQDGTGALRSRPMSNNGKVEFDGNVWFFSGAATRKVADIEATPEVVLNYARTEDFTFIAMSGNARIVRDAAKKRELWQKDLERWFTDGPDSDDVVLIKVTPTTVAYWMGEEDGEVHLT